MSTVLLHYFPVSIEEKFEGEDINKDLIYWPNICKQRVRGEQ